MKLLPALVVMWSLLYAATSITIYFRHYEKTSF